MTVCIGALCADRTGQPSRAAVVASDRMVTLGGLTEFEHEVPKIRRVSDKTLVLTAGDALRGAQLAGDVASHIPAGAVSVSSVAEAGVRAYVERRRQQIESTLFTPRGLTMEAFYNVLQSRLLAQLAGMLDQQVASFDFGVDALIAGVDDSGSHLYAVRNPGLMSDYAPIGYSSIGSGALHAMQSMIGFRHTSSRSLYECVFSVYASKRRAEVAPGVGQYTDMAVITDAGASFLASDVLDQLAQLYDQHERPVSEELRERILGLNLFPEEALNDQTPTI
jgi:20S proteasome alpha/beta subunit